MPFICSNLQGLPHPQIQHQRPCSGLRFCETCPLLSILSPLISFHPPLTLSQAPDLFMDPAAHQAYSCHRPLALAMPPVRYSPKYPEGFLPHPLAYSSTFAQKPVRLPLKTSYLPSSFTPKPAFPAILSYRTPGSDLTIQLTIAYYLSPHYT